MRRAKKTPDRGADSRPKLTVTGIGKIIGVSRATMYRRIRMEHFSLKGVPVVQTTGGNLYDMERVFKLVFPSADSNAIAGFMFDYMQKYGGLVK